MIESFLDMMLAERNASENTQQAYRRDLTEAAAFLAQRKIALEKASEDDLRAYIGSLGELAARTQARRLSALRQFFGFLCSENQRKEDPTRNIDAPRLGRSLPKHLSEDEVMRLLKAVARLKGADGARFKAMLELLYAAGLRVTELVSLPLSGVLFDRGIVQVKGKGGKERRVPLGDPAIAALKEWLLHRKTMLGDARHSTFLFPSFTGKKGYVTRQRFFQMLKDLALQAELDSARLSPHVLRHAFATHLLEHGADLRSVQTMLGHADIATTQIYTRVATDRLTRTVAEHHPLGKTTHSGKKQQSLDEDSV